MLQEPPWYIDPNVYIQEPREIMYFTDGSVMIDTNGQIRASAGYVRLDIANDYVVKYYNPIVSRVESSDINYVEAVAINMALQAIKSQVADIDTVSINSDSLINVNAMNNHNNAIKGVYGDQIKSNINVFDQLSETKNINMNKVKAHGNYAKQKRNFAINNNQKISTHKAKVIVEGNKIIDKAVGANCYYD